MVRYRCIGYGTTNGNGVATLERDLSDNSISGYTGQGVGEVDFVASAESPSEINSSSDVSQPYEVLDTIIRDGGINSDKNDNCWKELQTSNKGELNRFDTYSQIRETGTSNTIFSIQESNTYKQLPSSVMIEMDIKQVDGSSTDNIFSSRPNGVGNSDYLRSMNGFGFNDNDWHSIQLKLTPTRISAMVNGVEITGKDVSIEVSYWTFGLWTASNCTEIHFKNLRVYPI